MRILHVATATLLLGFTATGTPAFASCNSTNTCGFNQNATNTHGSGQYGLYSSHHSNTHRMSNQAANCPTGTSASVNGSCLVNSKTATRSTTSYTSTTASTYRSGSSHSMGGVSSYTPSYTGTLNSYASTTPFGATSTLSSAEASMRYGSGSISQSYKDGNTTIVPFSTSSMSSYRIPGMGANETLVPTQCPVSVYNPNGGKVLGCYGVAKPAPVRRVLRQVRIVRPIIYVRYPVPTPVYFPVYQQRPPVGYGHGYSVNNCGGGFNSGHTQQGFQDRWVGRPGSYPMPQAPRPYAPRPFTGVCGR